MRFFFFFFSGRRTTLDLWLIRAHVQARVTSGETYKAPGKSCRGDALQMNRRNLKWERKRGSSNDDSVLGSMFNLQERIAGEAWNPSNLTLALWGGPLKETRLRESASIAPEVEVHQFSLDNGSCRICERNHHFYPLGSWQDTRQKGKKSRTTTKTTKLNPN